MSHHPLLARARVRCLQLRSRLERQMRVRGEGLAQDRPHFPMRIACVIPCAMMLSATVAAQSIPAGGNGTLYVGTYARQVLVLDEATMTVRDSIKTSIGIPSLSLSF